MKITRLYNSYNTNKEDSIDKEDTTNKKNKIV